MERTEFGALRSRCACRGCVLNCQHMPGMLIPADLDRMIPPAIASISGALEWAADNLLASPGALVRVTATGEIVRVPTLVPAVKADGSCRYLTDRGRCSIHDAAPFGCAFFSCGPEVPGLSAQGVLAIHDAHVKYGLYHIIWQFLWDTGKRQEPAEALRERMKGTPVTSRGNLFTIRQIREALHAKNADLNADGSIRFTGTPPSVFMGIVTDDNEAIVTEDCFYSVSGEPHRLIDALPGDPTRRSMVIY